MAQQELNKEINMNLFKTNEFVKDRLLVFLKKNKDYGDSFLQSIEKFGTVAVEVRVWDKVNRFNQLMNTTGEVNDESLEDTVLDLFNYIMMFKAYAVSEEAIYIEELSKKMVEETNNLLYYSMECNYIYDYLVGQLDVPELQVSEIVYKLREQINKF